MAGTIAIAHPSCAVAMYFNGDNTCCYIRLRMDFDFDFDFDFDCVQINGTVSCCFWTSSLYVGIGAFLNSLVSLLLDVECTMAGTIAFAHPSCAVHKIHSNGNDTRCYIRLRMDFDFDFDFVQINGTVSCCFWADEQSVRCWY